MLRRLLPALLLLLLAIPAPAHAWGWGDTLTVILKPLPNLPSFGRPGDTLTVWADAPMSTSTFTASLLLGNENRLLTAAGGGWDASLLRWVLRYEIPVGTPENLYDLVLLSDATPPDTSRHAVKVLNQYKTDFYFAQISDTHLPTHAFSSNGQIDVSDTTAMADFDAVIDDLNLIHPEFTLHTGDIVNEGELEDYLGMYEMSRAERMLEQLRDPVFVVSGNHDQGGWKQTAPPDGTARKNWWRQFGWKFLGNPPPGAPYHSQNFSFDYGLFHGIGLEAYINNGGYDSYMQNIWGAQSFTTETMNWLAADIAAVPAGHSKLAFYHYDFGGTNPDGSPGANFSQINPAALGLDGAIWGHNHGVAEGAPNARPFNLGLQAVVDGRRAFRIFRVSNGVISPGFMHKSGGSSTIPTDSLTTTWSFPNDGTRSLNTANVDNRFQETWDYARLVFEMADHDSSFLCTGGTISQVRRHDGIATVTVAFVATQNTVTTVSVQTDQPIVTAVGGAPLPGLALAVRPVPVHPDAPLVVDFSLPAAGSARVTIFDITGRRVATLANLAAARPGPHELRWNAAGEGGTRLAAGVYLVRLDALGHTITRRIALVP